MSFRWPALNLRRQLLLVSVLLLTLPWAGCQFIREMEGALRLGQEQSLQATAEAVAAVLGQQEELLYPTPARRITPADTLGSIYAYPADQIIIVDGYADGWEHAVATQLKSASGSARLSVAYQAATRNDTLYLMLAVIDDDVVFHNPGVSREPNGDRLVLRTWRDGSRQEYVISTAAPGRVRATAQGPLGEATDGNRIRGVWQDTAEGYNLELEVPLSETGDRLGFYLVNVRQRAGGNFETLGNVKPLDTFAPPWLIYSPASLLTTLAPFAERGNHLQVVDKDNWLIADLPASGSAEADTRQTFWLLRLLYRSILAREEPMFVPNQEGTGRAAGEEISSALSGIDATTRYRESDYSTRTVLSSAVPIVYNDVVMGAVVARQSGEQYLSLTDQAFSKLLGYSLLALAVGALGLLAFASVLSWRIGRLSLAARKAIQEDDGTGAHFPRSTAADEIGELSRSYADLLAQLHEYNAYLRSLSRKLSHELRTPIAVIQSSLDNLEQSVDDNEQAGIYMLRAREGLQRLNSILTAMSEANRLEDSLRGASPRELDLVPLVKEMFNAYQDVYPDCDLRLDIAPQQARVNAVAELIVQALDKLIENATSFCSTEGAVCIALRSLPTGWQLSVSNNGPPLPDNLRDRLFDPMVSMRSDTSDAVHLGLGLHIVRLIAESLQGHVSARNLTEQDGVQFSMILPASETQTE